MWREYCRTDTRGKEWKVCKGYARKFRGGYEDPEVVEAGSVLQFDVEVISQPLSTEESETRSARNSDAIGHHAEEPERRLGDARLTSPQRSRLMMRPMVRLNGEGRRTGKGRRRSAQRCR